MTDPKVEEIRARLAAATPGPWCHYPEAGTIEIAEGGDEVHSGAILVSSVRPRLGWGADIYTGDEPDAEFIANAPTDIALLLAKLDEAETELTTRTEQWNEMFDFTEQLVAAAEAAEERERALIAGVKELVVRMNDLVTDTDRNDFDRGQGNVAEYVHQALSRLLPSTPTTLTESKEPEHEQ